LQSGAWVIVLGLGVNLVPEVAHEDLNSLKLQNYRLALSVSQMRDGLQLRRNVLSQIRKTFEAILYSREENVAFSDGLTDSSEVFNTLFILIELCGFTCCVNPINNLSN
jgi:hypothetical protein